MVLKLSRGKIILVGLAVGALIIITVSLAIALAAREACPYFDGAASPEVDSTARTMRSPFTDDGDHPEPYWKHIRLPPNLKPLHYDLLLYPDLDNGSFSGNVTIVVEVVEATSEFIVHAYKLKIKNVQVNAGDEKAPPSPPISIDNSFMFPQHEFFVIQLQKPAAVGTYRIFLQFQGSLVNQIVGFYRSKYVDTKTNQTRYLATSKFEPTYARRAFPCFDEPSFKPTFTVHLIHPKNYIALSNMNNESTVPFDKAKGLMKTSFKRSVPMTTYLACFVVCDFDYKESKTASGRPFRIYARPDQLSFTQLAFETASTILDDYEIYFDIPYPLPKQDMIAIPDFPSGAMEHWGLVTFRETRLLYDPDSTSALEMERMIKVIAHELTHQWFGNLVTMKWWDELWLNEGFASFFAYKGISKVKPGWEMDASIIDADMIRSFNFDAGPHSHPLVQSVSHPDEITAIFDSITYSKGSSVIRMLEGFMGKKKFQKGIQNFLKAHEYSHATTKDLLNVMAKESKGLNLTYIMDTWTLQKGFPVIHIKRSDTSFTASQTRYVLHPNSDDEDSPYGYTWEVPLFYRTEKQQEPQIIWLHQSTKPVSFNIENISNTEWVKFNADTTGYYRVNYELPEWNRLVQLLIDNVQTLNSCDRTGLIDDAFALAEVGHVHYRVPLSLAKYLSNEAIYEPWLTAMSHLRKIGRLLHTTADYGYFRKYVIKIVTPVYNRLGWKDSGTHIEKKLRSSILTLACDFQYDDCLKQSNLLLSQWLSDPNHKIAANLISVAIQQGMKNSNVEIWEKLWERYLRESSAQSRLNMLRGLAATQNSWLLNRLLNYAMNDSLIRSQDFGTVVAEVARNPSGGFLAWNFYRSRWEELVKRFTINDRYLGFLISPLTVWFSNEFQLDELNSFIEKYPNGGAGTRPREQAKNQVKANIRWLKTYKKQLAEWLTKNS